MADRDDTTARPSLADDMGRIAETLLDEQKRRVAETGHGIAAAFRQAATTFEEGHMASAADYADRAASGLDGFSEGLKQKDWRDMVEEAEDFARRQPALFVVGALAAGFLLGRFFSASAETRQAEQPAPSPDYAAGSSGTIA